MMAETATADTGKPKGSNQECEDRRKDDPRSAARAASRERTDAESSGRTPAWYQRLFH